MVTKKKNMKKERAITSDNLMADLLLSLKPSPDVTIAPNPSDCYDGDPAVKVVDSTTTVCNISRKRKLDELNPATADAKYSPECMVRNKDWLDDQGRFLVRLWQGHGPGKFFGHSVNFPHFDRNFLYILCLARACPGFF
ncbi:hypothetical protein HanPI659440_Chr11g0442131 [Helianthus annuus]|nr:hypothetical protein HanPI659440_Chr11g0442131 [Helianthus annuus]